MLAGVFGWFAMGVLGAEILNHFHLFEGRIPVGSLAVPMATVFLVSELLRNHFKRKALSFPECEATYRRFMTAVDISKFVIAVLLLVSIPFLWWGVIKKIAAAANAGKVLY